MKKLFILLSVVLGNLVFAQTPQFIHYQAVIRDGNGAVLSNQTVSLKIEITQGQNTYTEIRTVNTNNVGLVNLSIGNLPAPNSIPFSSINWAGGSTSMLTWYDPTGSGSNWQYISSSDIASVPYALHAANVFSGDFNDLTNIPSIDSSNTNEIQTISAQGDTIYLSNGGQIYYGRFSGNFADLNGVPAIDTSYTNELQTIAKNGDTISLSNGGGSVVVNTFSGDFNDLSNVPNLDTSNTNELQVLSMSGDTLYLSNGGFAVIPVDKWSESNGVVYRNSRVGINSINPDAQLEVNSTSSASNSQLGISITRSVSNNGWGVPLKFNLNDNTGQRYRYGQITGGIISNSAKTGFLSFSVADGNNWGIAFEQEMMRLTPTGLAIGLSNPIRPLHVNGSIRLNPMVSAPSVGAKGDIYVDANGSINFFNGTKWVNTQQVLELSGDTLKLRDGGNVILDLFSGDYNDLVNKPLIDSSSTNELQALSLNGDTLFLSNGGFVVIQQFSGLFEDLTGVPNIDTSSINEIQSLSLVGDSLILTDGGAVKLPVFSGDYNDLVNKPLIDSSSTNELQALSLNGDTLFLSNGGFVVIQQFSGLFEDLTGVPIIDTSYTNEIQTLTMVGDTIKLSNGGDVNLSNIGAKSLDDLIDSRSNLNNIGLGINALNDSVSFYNVAIGKNALKKNTGDMNVAIGWEAGGEQRNADGNVSIGMWANGSNVTGHSNIAIGGQALASNTSSGQVAIGRGALQNQVTGIGNLAIGDLSLNQNISGSGNTAIGMMALYESTGSNNTAVGTGTLRRNTIGENNTAVGRSALNENTTGYWNTAVGMNALVNNTTGYRNTSLGYRSMLVNTSGTFNTALGENSMESNTTGSENVAVGGSSLNSNTTGNRNVAIGWQALASNLDAVGNVAVGYQAMHDNSSGEANSAFGYWSLRSNDSGNYNNAFGFKSLELNESGLRNNAFGSMALNSLSSGNGNNAFGDRSLLSVAIGNGNNAFGELTLSNSTGSNNSAFGHQTMRYNTTGDDNAAFGKEALLNTSSGGSNVAIGAGAMLKNETGSFNTAIGAFADVGTSTLNNATAVGGQAIVEESNSIQLGNEDITKINTSGKYFGAGGAYSDSSSSGNSSILELSSNTKGFLFPRMTSKERDNISMPFPGLAIFCLDCGPYGELEIFNGTFWGTISGDSASLSRDSIPLNGLVGWWPLNGNGKDFSGNGLDGVQYSTMAGLDRFNDSLSAVSFNGTNSYIEIPSNSIFDSLVNEISISIWVKPSVSSSDGTLVARRNFVGNPNGERHHFEVTLKANGAISFSAFDNSKLNTNIQYESPINAVIYNDWNHIVVTFSNSVLKIYINGIRVLNQPLSNQELSPNTHWLNFGRIHRSSGTPFFNEFTGDLDEIGIWNRVLSPTEVIMIRNSRR